MSKSEMKKIATNQNGTENIESPKDKKVHYKSLWGAVFFTLLNPVFMIILMNRSIGEIALSMLIFNTLAQMCIDLYPEKDKGKYSAILRIVPVISAILLLLIK